MLEIRRCHTVWLAAAASLILQWSLPANASVTCFGRRHGQYVCTFFCQNGFTCDNDNLRCLPGPALKQHVSDLQEKARQAKLQSNRTQAKSAQQANSQSLGYGTASTYYIWNGDPREIPTPRYRSSGGFTPLPSGGGSRAAGQTVRQSLQARVAAVRSGGTISLPSITLGRSSETSGASSSGPSISSKPKVLPKYWEGVDYTNYCANANGVDRGSAYYGYYCTPDEPSSAPADQDNYRPFPDPKDLDRKVSEICGPYSRDTRQCFFENKSRMILASNPDIRDACADLLGVQTPADKQRDQLAKRLGDDEYPRDPNINSYNICVDNAYLHGLHHKSTRNLSEELRRRMANKSGGADNPVNSENVEPLKPPPVRLPNDGCPSGFGLKPDRSAFGAWTCQPLGGDFPGYNNQGADAQDAGPTAPQDQTNPQDQANAADDPTAEELEAYLNMINPNSGSTMGGNLGDPKLRWGTDDYQAIEKLQQ